MYKKFPLPIPSDLTSLQALLWEGIPESYAPFVFGAFALRLFEESSPDIPVYVCESNEHLAQFSKGLRFFYPKMNFMEFLAWDTTPYDRVSPDPQLMTQRLMTLNTLMQPAHLPMALLTTVRAIAQKVLPSSELKGVTLQLKKGTEISREKLSTFCDLNGFKRVDVVRERGEVAFRGGVIDLFLPQEDMPLRLDLFGDEVESMRTFDPLSQRTQESVEELTIMPASELFLTPAHIKMFKTRYVQTFGVKALNDPLLECLCAGESVRGAENWLPFFYEKLVPLWEWLPKAIWVTGIKVKSAFDHFMQEVDDHYTARLQSSEIDTKMNEESREHAYRPVPWDAFYLPYDSFYKILEKGPHITFSPFMSQQGISFDCQVPVLTGTPAQRIAHIGKKTASEKQNVFFTAPHRSALQELLPIITDKEQHSVQKVDTWREACTLQTGQWGAFLSPLEKGFQAPSLHIYTYGDIFGKAPRHKGKRPSRNNLGLEISSFVEGDYLVHRDHGVGQFLALIQITVDGAPHECVQLLYDKGDKLYVPIENLDLLTKYSSSLATVSLDRLGSPAWQKRAALVKKRLREIADELLATAAARSLEEGIIIPTARELLAEFTQTFPHVETEDQLESMEAVYNDLASHRPMDRLICGDVGFGKTEVALRAAFLTAMAGYQVVVLVPTTILCRQHYQTFVERLKSFGLKVAQLSRMVSARQQKQTLEEIKEGKINILISTHGLFSPKTIFQNLGLIVIDEEQHFGVVQKEYLKKMQKQVNLLTMSATPIPRTLQLAVSGVKDLSLIATPPLDRLAVKPFVIPYDTMLIREAILREHHRGGQVYVVCPRISDMPALARKLQALVPDISIGQAHGQLSMRQLDETMQDFYEGKFTILLATNIVESGLDVPRANTLIVYNAHLFGLSQLYQLRGRIGRSKHRGYAYFLLPQHGQLQGQAGRRLEVIQTLDTLGAGFSLASHDMDIRGAGNLLGQEQSGHIKEVGLELYQQMLQEAIEMQQSKKEGKATEPTFTPLINTGVPLLIPETYVGELALRIGLYRRMSEFTSYEELEDFSQEMMDRFGPLPRAVQNLIRVMEMKVLCKSLGIEKLERGVKGIVFSFHKDFFKPSDSFISYLQSLAPHVKLLPDFRLLLTQAWPTAEDGLEGTYQFLKELEKRINV